jgi:sulfite exporter TauE/SafE
MCGPLALALPLGKLSPLAKALARLNFVGGRVLVYILMGGLVGALGAGVSWLGFQKIGLISLAGSLFFLVAGWEVDFFKKFRKRLQSYSKTLIESQPGSGHFLLGMGNGLLPCGLVYGALANASLSQNWQQGMLIMGIFGLATSWWHLVLALPFSFTIPRWQIFRLFSSPRTSLALVTLALVWRIWHLPHAELQNSNQGKTPTDWVCSKP